MLYLLRINNDIYSFVGNHDSNDLIFVHFYFKRIKINELRNFFFLYLRDFVT